MDGPAFAFLAACAFALGTVLQQRGTLGTTSGSGDSHWLIQILYKPVWLAGLLFHVSGWVPLRHRRHDVDAMVVTPAGPASGRKPSVRHRAGHRGTP